MRKLFVLTLAISLAGCASVYDASAWPDAFQRNKLAYEQCRVTASKTYDGWTNCMLAGDKAFALEIKLRNMDLFNTYAARMMLAANDARFARISYGVWVARVTAIQSDYMNAIGQAYDLNAARNAEMAALGVAFSQGLAQGQANQPRPTICTSAQTGTNVSTICN